MMSVYGPGNLVAQVQQALTDAVHITRVGCVECDVCVSVMWIGCTCIVEVMGAGDGVSIASCRVCILLLVQIECVSFPQAVEATFLAADTLTWKQKHTLRYKTCLQHA